MHEFAKELQAIAQTGLHYTKDKYDRERYKRLQQMALEFITELSSVDMSLIEKFYIPEKGYATPKVDLRACIVRDNHVLLVRERSDGKWTLPGGWADQNESPSEGIIREVKEESGYEIKVKSLYALRDRDRNRYTPKYPVSIYKLFFTGTIVGGSPIETLETSELGFFSVDSLPILSEDRVLAGDIRSGVSAFHSETVTTLFD